MHFFIKTTNHDKGNGRDEMSRNTFLNTKSEHNASGETFNFQAVNNNPGSSRQHNGLIDGNIPQGNQTLDVSQNNDLRNAIDYQRNI